MIVFDMFIYFVILSFVGYIYECTAMTFWTGKWDNRGFLYGPIIPIYGAGALLSTLFFTYMMKNHTPMQVFLIGMLSTAVLEFVVHYIMEKMFHEVWWDYSKSIWNIQGRICLPASVGFGIGILLVIYAVNPYLLPAIRWMNDTFVKYLVLLLLVVICLDCYYTVKSEKGYYGMADRYTAVFDSKMEHMVDRYLDESKAWNTRVYKVFEKIDKKDRSKM